MELFENKEEFIQIIKLTSEYFGMDSSLIEKDYFVTLLLKKACEKIPGLVFKGGTSLSKCFKVIDRFSEDLDLTLDISHFSQSQKRNAVKELIDVCDSSVFVLENRLQIEEHTHGNYNCFLVEYPIVFLSDNITPHLKAEMSYIQKSYPCDSVKAGSYIADFLAEKGYDDIIKEYNLEPFTIQAQSLERTMIDKVFAVGDYYLSGSFLRNSRHIYDLSRLVKRVNLSDPGMKELVSKVRAERMASKVCLSAQNDVDMQAVLEKIVREEAFKRDYIDVTMKLLTKTVRYEEAIQSLDKIVNSKLFE